MGVIDVGVQTTMDSQLIWSIGGSIPDFDYTADPALGRLLAVVHDFRDDPDPS